LLLDTHIWLWLLEGSRSHTASDLLPLLDRSGATSNLFVSDISYWEVAVKAAKGKLTLSVDVAGFGGVPKRCRGWRKRPEL
jgi:PIN domain nuclease of toxin-antitoxin system